MPSTLAKKPTNPDFQSLCERRDFIVHDVALTAFHLGNGSLIHTNPRSGEPAAQVIRSISRTPPKKQVVSEMSHFAVGLPGRSSTNPSTLAIHSWASLSAEAPDAPDKQSGVAS
jgi:hypothetical protein